LFSGGQPESDQSFVLMNMNIWYDDMIVDDTKFCYLFSCFTV
jgi:hypothetical protein